MTAHPRPRLADNKSVDHQATRPEPSQLLEALHAEGSTICMVTHDPRYAEHAERSIHLFDGHVGDGITAHVSH